MIAELDGDSSQHQQPEHDHQREIESAETRSIERRKSHEESNAAGDQPDFVSVPYRPNGAKNDLAFLRVSPERKMKRPGSQVESIQHYVPGNHERGKAEPDEVDHRVYTSLASMAPAGVSGPCSISR